MLGVAAAATYEQRRVARQLRDQGIDWWVIAARLRTLYTIGGLAAARQAHDWSQQQAVDEWRRRWPTEPVEQKTLSAWECWPHGRSGHAPSLDTLARLAELYEVAAADLIAGWADFRSSNNPGALGGGYPADVDRRQFIGVTTGAIAAAALPAAALPATGRVAAVDVERLSTQALDLWITIHHRGAGAYRDVVDHITAVRRVIETATYSDTTGIALQRVAGHLHYLAGVCAFDEVHSPEAWAHLNEGYRIARGADDNRLAVLTLVEMSLEASLTGSGRDGIDLAVEAGQLGRGFATPRLRSRLAAREALGHAVLGDAAAADAGLARAERFLDEESWELGDGSWLDRSHWDAGGFTHAVGASHLALGAPVAAERASRRSVDECRPDWPRSKALFSAQLAAALLAAGKVDEAAAAVVGTLDLLDGVRSPRTIADLRALRPALEPHQAVAGVRPALTALACA